MIYGKKNDIRIKRVKSVDSTNSFIKRNLSVLGGWFSLAADTQTEGRGRENRKWFSESGKDLTFSLLVPPGTVSPERVPNITQACGLAVCAFLDSKGIAATIKWPNDILVEGKKICGILTEGVFLGQKQYIICGVGLNCASREQSVGAYIKTSLAALTGRTIAPDQVHGPLSEMIRDYILHLARPDGLEMLCRSLNERLFGTGDVVEFRENSATPPVYGILEGVSDTGCLILNVKGRYLHCISGELLPRRL
ncbi:MAG: biotin--[acetyl-CoA-carboxylase] ligase [Fibrobacterota bacterium]